MEKSLRKLIGQYGYKRVEEEVNRILEDMYRDYKKVLIKDVISKRDGVAEAPPITQNEAVVEAINPHRECEATFSKNIEAVDTKNEATSKKLKKDQMNKVEGKKKQCIPFYLRRNPNNPITIAKDARRKEMKEKGIRKKDLVTKENLEKWLKEGRSYESMAKEVGISSTRIRKHCDKYNLERTSGAQELEERKKNPDGYEKILNNPTELQKKHDECRKIAKECVKENIILDTRAGVYGIFTRESKECIYIGSTKNFELRNTIHKDKYEKEYKMYLMTLIKERGGWDNHILIPLEYRENTKGLNVVEAIWYDSLQPIGNKMRPI